MSKKRGTEIDKNIFSYCLHMCLLVPVLFSQVTEEWVRRYNNALNGNEAATSIAVDNSGNTCVACSSPAVILQRKWLW